MQIEIFVRVGFVRVYMAVVLIQETDRLRPANAINHQWEGKTQT